MRVKRLLESHDCEFMEAESGLKALMLLNDYKPDFIITDIMMPELDGLKLAQALKNREQTKDIPLLFLTSRDDSKTIIETIQLGASQFVSKANIETELVPKFESMKSSSKK